MQRVYDRSSFNLVFPVCTKTITLYYILMYFELRLVRLELFYLSKSKCNELWPKSVKLLNYTELSLLSSVGIIFKAGTCKILLEIMKMDLLHFVRNYALGYLI